MREHESINELERHVLACMAESAVLERREGYEGWVCPPDLPDDWTAALERLLDLGLAERQANSPEWVRCTEAGESLIAQIEARESTKQ